VEVGTPVSLRVPVKEALAPVTVAVALPVVIAEVEIEVEVELRRAP
jgi:hypothetical protein